MLVYCNRMSNAASWCNSNGSNYKTVWLTFRFFPWLKQSLKIPAHRRPLRRNETAGMTFLLNNWKKWSIKYLSFTFTCCKVGTLLPHYLHSINHSNHSFLGFDIYCSAVDRRVWGLYGTDDRIRGVLGWEIVKKRCNLKLLWPILIHPMVFDRKAWG
jgi:hypothetical protein